MRSKARCLYINEDTFENLIKLAGLKRISLSAMVTIIINDAFFARHHLEQKICYQCSKCVEYNWRATSDDVGIIGQDDLIAGNHPSHNEIGSLEQNHHQML